MKYLMLSILILLTGCNAKTVVPTKEELVSQNIAFLSVKDASIWKGEFAPLIHTAFNSNGKKVLKSSFWDGSLSEAKLPSGEYLFVILCDNGSISSLPKLKVSLEAGKAYEFSCVAETEEILGIDFNKSVTAKVTTVN